MTLILLLLAGLALARCSSRQQVIQVAGSTTVLPIVSKAAERFRLRRPEVKIIVNAGGSGVGINQLGEGTVQIGMASRDLTEEEKNRYPQVHFVPHTVARDAVVPVVSSEIFQAGVRQLSLRQIAAIYRGEISNWKELGGPDREILAVDKEKSRGTRHVFMAAVLGDRQAEAPGADLVLGSNNEEQTAIAQSDSAIGMLSQAWLNREVRGLAVVLEDGSVVEPTLENIANGSFPILRDLLLLTDGPPTGEVRDFIDFLLSPEGQQIVKESGYVAVGGS